MAFMPAAPQYPLARPMNASWGIKKLWSPNYSVLPGRRVEQVVMHITDGTTANGALAHFARPQSQVSAHFVIDRDGTVFQCVPLEFVAWHAGKPVNARSIGIEHVGNKANPVTPATYQSSARLVSWLLRRYKLDETAVVGHYDVAPESGHRGCPTDALSWEHFWFWFNRLPQETPPPPNAA